MTIPGSEAGDFLAQLVMAGARTLILAGISGVLLRALGVKAASRRLFTWTAVLYAGLCMPVLQEMLPALQIPIWFLRSAPARPVSGVGGSAPVVSAARTTDAEPIRSAADARQSVAGPASRDEGSSRTAFAASMRWITVAECAYLLIALLLLVRLLIGVVFALRLVRFSRPIEAARVNVCLVSSPHLSGRRRRPSIRESRSVSVPLTVGISTPTIILPGSWREWDDDKLASVLAHEMSHVRRHDCLSQSLSLLHRAIFWFSPLAWWLNRQIVELAEQASDEEVLSRGVDQNRYARMLLGFLESVQAAPGRIRWQGVSIASSGRSERRLERVLSWRGDKKMNAKKSALIVVAAVAIPASFLVAAGRPVSPAQSAARQGFTQSAPAAPTANAIAAPASPPALSATPAGPAVAAAPESPAAPEAEQDQNSPANHSPGFSYRYGYDDEQRFVIVSGKTNAFTMSGSSEDARHAEKLKQQIPGDFIWFERDEKSYIIRDQATVDQARQLWSPQEELGKKQEALGKQQEALGRQQQEIGSRMQAVRVKVPDMTAELEEVKAELKQLGPDATVEQMGRIQSKIGQLQSKIGEIQSHAGEEQGKLGSQMGALGEKQGELGRQQGELGREQGKLAEKAGREMKQLLDDAIKKGIAQPENPEPGGASL